MKSSGHCISRSGAALGPPKPSGEGGSGAVRNGKPFRSTRRPTPATPELGFARNASEVRQLRSEGRLAIMLHMTCSAQLAEDLAMLRIYHRLGLKSLHFSADAAGDSETPADDDVGLRPFGVELVREMDRLGMPIDVSHSSDKAFWDIMELSQGTVYASHSNCRALSNARRNVTDDMIRALADHNGVVGMHFASGLCEYQHHKKHMHQLSPYVTEVQVLTRELHAKYPDPWDFQKAFLDPAQNPGFDPKYLDKFGFPLPVPFEKMVDHIDHVCALVGPDHVALGSDWYGGQTSMLGLEHIGKMPAVTKELVRRGYSREDVEKIMGGNWLRIFE